MPKLRYSHQLSSEEIRERLIMFAPLFKKHFLDYRYLIYSEHFKRKKYYIIDAQGSNFLHLTGVKTNLPAKVFFEKCLNGEIAVSDFESIYPGQPDKPHVIYSKLMTFENISNILSCNSHFEENFSKGKVECVLATSDSSCTLGFYEGPKSLRPKTLMKGDELKKEPRKYIDLVLRVPNIEGSDGLFSEIVSGDTRILRKHIKLFRGLISQGLLNSIK